MYPWATYLRTRQSAFCALVLLASIVGAFGQSPPVNDDFANRTSVSGSPLTLTGTLVGSTYESAETNLNNFLFIPGGGTVWWSWTASQSTTVVIEAVVGSSAAQYPSMFEVYAGTNLNALTGLDGNVLDGLPGRYVAFSAVAGVSYQFRVFGLWPGSFTLKLIATNPPLFLKQPQDCVVSPHGSAFFSTLAVGLPSYSVRFPKTTYQWSFNGVPIPREICPTLVVHNVSTNEVGSYSVIASNSGGMTQSAVATLTMIETNSVPQIKALSPTNPALLSFSLTGEGGRWYEYESSQDLKTWGSRVWFQPTNATTVLSIPRLKPTHFVRSSLNFSTDACVAQLKRMRDSCVIRAIEERIAAGAAVTKANIAPLIPLDETGNLPHCPEGGVYAVDINTNNPTCTIHGHGHEITNP